MRRIVLSWGCLNCFRNTEANGQFVPGSVWLSTAEVKKIRGVIELAATDPKCTVKFAYQVADTINCGFAHFALGSAKSTDGVVFGTMTDIFDNLDDKQLIRFGFLVWTSDATDNVLHCCQGGGFVEYTGC